jgi:hypothetical protein
LREVGRKELHSYREVGLEALGPVDNAHPSAAEVFENLVVGNSLADLGKPTLTCIIPTARRNAAKKVCEIEFGASCVWRGPPH